MLRPAVQPGSNTGYHLPDEEVTLTLASPRPLAVKSPGTSPESLPGEGGRHLVRITVRPKEHQPLPLEISLETGKSTELHLSWTTDEDACP